MYAIGPSDVRYDETVPGEMGRYNALYEQVDELLDSFQLDSIHALVQEWLEDRVKQGPPEGTQGYDYLDGRVQCLSFQRMELGYAVTNWLPLLVDTRKTWWLPEAWSWMRRAGCGIAL